MNQRTQMQLPLESSEVKAEASQKSMPPDGMERKVEDLKRCPGCKEFKDRSFFAHSKWKKDGLQCWCNPCKAKLAKRLRDSDPQRTLEMDRAFKVRHRERLRLAARKRWSENKERCSANDKRSRLKHAQKTKARQAVNLSVKSKRIPAIKTLKCNACHEMASHYHHHNGYSDEHALDVIPLCSPCHGKAHQIILTLT